MELANERNHRSVEKTTSIGEIMAISKGRNSLVLEVDGRIFFKAILVATIIGMILGSLITIAASGMVSKTVTERVYNEFQDTFTTMARQDKEFEVMATNMSTVTAEKADMQNELETAKIKIVQYEERLKNIEKYEQLLIGGKYDQLKTGTLAKGKQDFVHKLIPGALKGYAEDGVLPSVNIAMAIHESNWGESGLSVVAKNYYGVKSNKNWNGPTYSVSTKEFYGAGPTTIKAAFRAYSDWQDSQRDYIRIMTGPRYAKAINAANYKAAVQAIKNAGYASDPKYVAKIVGTIEQYELHHLDQQL